jgi:hypothetical protein
MIAKKPVEKPGTSAAKPVGEASADEDLKQFDVDDLSLLARKLLMDKDLELSKIRPFFWTLVEIYVDRFQLFPFDAVKALLNYLEFHDYPEGQLRGLIGQLQDIYEEQHGRSIKESVQVSASNVMLDDEIKELRESLKYAALVGERIESYD